MCHKIKTQKSINNGWSEKLFHYFDIAINGENLTLSIRYFTLKFAELCNLLTHVISMPQWIKYLLIWKNPRSHNF